MGLFSGPSLFSKEEYERGVHLNLISRVNSLELRAHELCAKLQVAQGRIEELEAFRKKELDFYLWDKKQMSRRIALLGGWMQKLFKYADNNRNQLTMTTEIPDTLIREGLDYLNRETLEKGDE